MKNFFSKCLLLLSVLAVPFAWTMVQAADLWPETTSAIQFIGSSAVCWSVDFADSSECGIYEPVIDLADQAVGIIESFIQSYDNDTKIYVYEYLLDYFEGKLAEPNITSVERVYYGWISYNIMESLNEISWDDDLSDILCELFSWDCGWNINTWSSIFWYSEDWDYIGQWVKKLYTDWVEYTSVNSEVTWTTLKFTLDAPEIWNAFSLEFEWDYNELPTNRSYTLATRYPFNGDEPGVSVSWDGRWCNTLNAEFTVRDLLHDGQNIQRAAIDFVQYCWKPTNPPLYGSIRVNSLIPHSCNQNGCNQLVNQTQFSVSENLAVIKENRTPTRIEYDHSFAINEFKAIDPVLSYTVPEWIWCLEKIDSVRWEKFISTDDWQNWISWTNEWNECTVVTNIKVILRDSSSNIGNYRSRLLFFNDNDSISDEFCIDLLLSADNAQYQEYISCATPPWVWEPTSVEVNSIGLTDVEVVYGALNVDAIKFEVETNSEWPVVLDSMFIRGYANDDSITPESVGWIRLWRRTPDWYTLIQYLLWTAMREWFTRLSFNEYVVPADTTQEFLVTVDIPVDPNNIWKILSFDGSDIRSRTIWWNVLPQRSVNSNRDILVTGAGELRVEADNSDSEADDKKYIVAGTPEDQSEFVASFELTAQNEWVEIEDMVLNIVGANDFDDAVQEVIIYAEDKSTIIDSSVPTDGTSVLFDTISNFTVEEWSINIYVKIITNLIGINEEWQSLADVQFTLSVLASEGRDSGEEVVVTYENSTTSSDPTTAFSVVPVSFSDAEFVTSAAGVNVDTTTTDGNDMNLAILKLTASDRENTDRNNASDLEAIVSRLRFEVSNPIGISNYEIRRIWNGSTNYIAWNVDGDMIDFNLDLVDVNTKEFTSWEVWYYLIRADVQVGQTSSSVKLILDNLNGWVDATDAPIVYAPSDDLSEQYRELRLEDDLIESSNVTINNN